MYVNGKFLSPLENDRAPQNLLPNLYTRPYFLESYSIQSGSVDLLQTLYLVKDKQKTNGVSD